MRIALTGGTGFIGRYIIDNLLEHAHQLRCWYRPQTLLPQALEEHPAVEWIEGDLANCQTASELVGNCDAVVHNAFWKPGEKFQGQEGDVVKFVETNLVGSLKLIEAAIAAGAQKFVFVSTCAVHEKILDDRSLDEAHPLWPRTHYGAHKAAVEKFVHSYGLGHGFDICAVRPTGVYGLHHQAEKSKWYGLISSVVRGQDVQCDRGGKEVHAQDVAKSIHHLLKQPPTPGEVFSCYDRYVSQFEVATLAKEICGSSSQILGEATQPRNQIDNSKIKGLGMGFGGTSLLKKTVETIVQKIVAEKHAD